MPPPPAALSGRPAVPLAAYGHLLTVYLVWGSAYFAVKLCLTGTMAVTPLQLQTVRLWSGGLLLALVTGLRSGLPRQIGWRDLGLCGLTGGLMWVSGNGLATLASRHAASGFIVMAMGAIPLWSSLIDLVISRRRPPGRLIGALLLGLGGLLLVVGPALSGGGGVTAGYGLETIILLLGAGATWALGTVLQRPLIGRLSPGWAASLQMLGAAVVLSGPLALSGLPAPFTPDLRQIGAFLFLVVFASVICLTSYIAVVRRFSPPIAATFAYVNPVVGILLGWLLLGERPAWISLIGMGIVLISVGLVLSPPGRPRSG